MVRLPFDFQVGSLYVYSMNEYVGLFLMTFLWLSISYILFRIIKRKHEKKPFNIRKMLDKQNNWFPND